MFDLGYAVDAAQQNFGRNPLLHIVQASAFSPPFREKTFDLVYSQGVIMATLLDEDRIRPARKASEDRRPTLYLGLQSIR